MTVEQAAALTCRDVGRLGYGEAMRLQDDLVEQRIRDEVPDTVLLLEHPPVITVGRRGTLEDVYLSEAQLALRGIALERTTRGGLVTYHGPGQVVAYPIVKLRPRGLSVPCYVRALELAIIASLGRLGVGAYVDPEHVGVWTAHGKIAAIGVAQRHGVTLHGLAVNLQPDLAHFKLINPCGIGELGITSVESILGTRVDPDAFKRSLAESLENGLRGTECTPA